MVTAKVKLGVENLKGKIQTGLYAVSLARLEVTERCRRSDMKLLGILPPRILRHQLQVWTSS